jgi:hypothetical protein
VTARSHRVTILIALLISISVDAVWAAPARATKAVAAVTCCTKYCTRLAGVVCNNGCCPLTGSPDSPVIQRDGARDHTVVSSVAQGVILAIAAPRTEAGVLPSRDCTTGDPPSLLLLTRTLRL